MKPVKRIDRRAGPGRFFYFAENGAERNTKNGLFNQIARRL